MTTEEGLPKSCPEAAEFSSWYTAEALPRCREYIVHIRNCQRCKDALFSLKDKFGFDLLKASDEEVMTMLLSIPQEYLRGVDK